MSAKIYNLYVLPDMFREQSSTGQHLPLANKHLTEGILHLLHRPKIQNVLKEHPQRQIKSFHPHDKIGENFEALYNIASYLLPHTPLKTPRDVLNTWELKRRNHATLWKEMLSCQKYIAEDYRGEALIHKIRSEKNTSKGHVKFDLPTLLKDPHGQMLCHQNQNLQTERDLILHLMMADTHTSYSDLTKHLPMVHFDLKTDILKTMGRHKQSDIRTERFNRFTQQERLQRDNEFYNFIKDIPEIQKHSPQISIRILGKNKSSTGYIHGNIHYNGNAITLQVNGTHKSSSLTLHCASQKHVAEFKLRQKESEKYIKPLCLDISKNAQGYQLHHIGIATHNPPENTSFKTR